MAGRRGRRRRRGLETLKSALIVLLSLSAVFLALWALEGTAPGDGPLHGLLSLWRGEQEPASSGWENAGPAMAAPQPARLSVYDGEERFGVQYDQAQADRLFEQVGILLSEALASAGQPNPVGEREWRQALCSPGVWYGFLGQLPLEVLSVWMGVDGAPPLSGASASQLAVALEEDGTVGLYYRDEGDGRYYACTTAVVYQGHMDALVTGYGGNGVRFAFETDGGGWYDGLDPYVLLSPTPPAPPVYAAGNPLSGMGDEMVSALQQALAFQVQSSAIYPVSGGLRIRDGAETLELSHDGLVVYHTAEPSASRYVVEEPDNVASLVDTTLGLAWETVGSWCGAGTLYLAQVVQGAEETYIRYEYSLNGTAVSLSQGRPAAGFTIREGRVVDFTLTCRSYEATGQTGLVLGQLQAAAALEALDSAGRVLALRYSDGGGDTVQAGWTAE